MRTLRTIPWILLLGAAASAAAPDDPATALRSFIQAIENADAARLRELIWSRPGSISQARAADLFADYVARRNSLQREAVRLFAAAGERLGAALHHVLGTAPHAAPATTAPATTSPVGSVLAAVDSATVSPDGRSARVVIRGEARTVILRRVQAPESGDPSAPWSQWRIVIAFIDAMEDITPGDFLPPVRPDPRLQALERMSEAVELTLQSLREGRFASAHEAETDLARNLSIATAEQPRRP
jgi:hypothetical protein